MKDAQYSGDKSEGESNDVSIFLPNKAIKGKSNGYVGIICESQNCKVKIDISIASERFFVADGENNVFESSSTHSESSTIIRLKVPSSSQDQGVPSRIMIHAEALYHESSKDIPNLY